MVFFGTASTKLVDQTAKLLASEVLKLRPPEQGRGLNAPGVSLKTLERKVDDLFVLATAFRKEHKLGVYKKARLANTFRWELKERGCDDVFIEAITEKLVIALAKKD